MKLREYLYRRGITLAALARELGMSHQGLHAKLESDWQVVTLKDGSLRLVKNKYALALPPIESEEKQNA